MFLELSGIPDRRLLRGILLLLGDQNLVPSSKQLFRTALFLSLAYKNSSCYFFFFSWNMNLQIELLNNYYPTENLQDLCGFIVPQCCGGV